MKPTKQEKLKMSRALGDEIQAAPQVFFADFQGLKFAELDDLRGKLRPVKGRCRVVKNSILHHALKKAGVDGGVPPRVLKGPVAVVFGEDADPIGAAKVLASFARQFPQLKVKAGFVDGMWIQSEACIGLSKLSSKAESLAQLAGALYEALARSASVLQAPMRDLALALSALEKKKSEAAQLCKS